MLHSKPGADLGLAATTLRPRPSGGGAAFESHLRPSGRVAVLFGFEAGLRFEDALALLGGNGGGLLVVRLGGRPRQFLLLFADKFGFLPLERAGHGRLGAFLDVFAFRVGIFVARADVSLGFAEVERVHVLEVNDLEPLLELIPRQVADCSARQDIVSDTEKKIYSICLECKKINRKINSNWSITFGLYKKHSEVKER